MVWRGRELPRALMVACLAVVLSACAGHPGGDPDGSRASTSREVRAALPEGATIRSSNSAAPTWSSCDGRPETEGWTDVIEAVSFTVPGQPDALVAHADEVLHGRGWTSDQALHTPLGPGRVWHKVTPGGVRVQASLSPASDGAVTYWNLSASAPPQGQRASGC
jgi:hypothetical protein